jgi:hypothetical protein
MLDGRKEGQLIGKLFLQFLAVYGSDVEKAFRYE